MARGGGEGALDGLATAQTGGEGLAGEVVALGIQSLYPESERAQLGVSIADRFRKLGPVRPRVTVHPKRTAAPPTAPPFAHRNPRSTSKTRHHKPQNRPD
jgi:hypothetical protein